MNEAMRLDQGDDEPRTVGSVLCVDDEPNILTALRRLLRTTGHELLTADSAEAALEVLRRRGVDMIITDMRMPGMDGAQLMETVAHRWPDISRMVLTGYSDMEAAKRAINNGHVHFYLNKPWDDVQLLLIVEQAIYQKKIQDEQRALRAKLSRRQLELSALNRTLEQQVEERTRSLQETNRQLLKTQDELRHSYMQVVNALAHLVRLREGRADSHSVSVAKLAVAIATQLALPKYDLEMIYIGGVLHDIGETVLPDELVNVPPEGLTLAQRAQAQQHPVLGAALLINVPELGEVARIIRHHHEQVDGLGFPDGLRGAAIPLAARIVAVADEYDRLIKGIDRERPLDRASSIKRIAGDAGIRFDKRVVKAFLRVMEKRQNEHPEVRYRSGQLRVGQRLSRDLFGKGGMLMVSAGQTINESLIHMLKQFEEETGTQLEVYVYQ